MPDHSSLTVIRQRLPLELHEVVLVLRVLSQKGVLRGKTIGLDATTLEANAAMKSIVRRDTGESWREYIRRLPQKKISKTPATTTRGVWSAGERRSGFRTRTGRRRATRKDGSPS